MIDKVHQHIMNELQQSSRTDTIFVVTAILFNLIVLAVNSGVASSAVKENAESSADVVLVVFVIMAIVVNSISIVALDAGKGTRKKLLNGLLAMYKDSQVERYYDASLLTSYGKRYILFTAAILCLAVASVLVPLVIRFL